MRICKTVMQLNSMLDLPPAGLRVKLEAERRGQPQPKPPGKPNEKPNEKQRPKLAATTPFEPDARTAWLLYLRSGKVAAR